jgi:hypothetical protein
MAKSSTLFFGTCISVFWILTSFDVATACPPCPKGEVCVEACGPAFCQRNKVEALPQNCAMADFTIGTKRIRIQKQLDQSMTLERLPDLKTK